jgi:predicted DNA-binding protein
MSIAMKDVKIKPDLLKVISKIAKNQHTTENEIINDFIVKGIEEIEDEIDISIIAEEFGQTKEELIKELDEAREEIAQGKGIKLDVDNLEEMFKS